MLSLDYIAAFIDAEGCISTYVAKDSITVGLAIVNINRDILQEISDSVCGVTSTTPRKILSREGSSLYDDYDRRTIYTYKMGTAALRILLPSLIPILRLKRYQAETALELLKLTPTKKEGNNTPDLDRNWNERLELADKICWANQGCP